MAFENSFRGLNKKMYDISSQNLQYTTLINQYKSIFISFWENLQSMDIKYEVMNEKLAAVNLKVKQQLELN